MSNRYFEIMFTPTVREQQAHYGSCAKYSRVQAQDGQNDALGSREAEFLSQADSFYLATVGETGWPYVQHRGGPIGFLRILSPKVIAFADFRGNQQFISAGNVARDDRVSIFVMDYANRQRLKLLGRLRFMDVSAANPGLVRWIELPDYQAHVERVALIDVVAYDWNCPQHITPRFTAEQWNAQFKSRGGQAT